ncbi:aminotransferase-like domain-containing protein [Streptomyces fuscichromogenes]|uniref:GntR family transcriptional regulator n=1 Tax=Streptomyces fuscichromogenes TaxID=1324013 RepID=A0A917XBA4_9ACTN|nr:PLP-dependent aminotransferase family protein [Streptomyces fuscichromogenes]GGN04240.1 GntR family transcriptional regulator [Streptomyces fuscichromogenes]
MDDFRGIADRIALDIARGRLRAGQRLPPQRAFARRHGIAASTAGRVYAELVRRGLVVGEVGRGTFVRAAPVAPQGRALVEDGAAARVNLELNYPSAPGQSQLLAPALAALLRPEALTDALRPAAADGTPQAREAAAELLATGDWRPDPGRVLFTGNARQAVAATLGSLVRPGDRIGVEPLTYPLVKEIAGRLGGMLVPVRTDEHGPVVESLLAAHRSAPLSALYLQPTLHNPTSLTVPTERRLQLARAVSDLGLPVVEDQIWSFLHRGPEPPLAALAPRLVHLVDGLSKRVAPGLTAGFAVVPEGRVDAVAAAVRSGGWSAGAFALEAAVRWIGDGTVGRLVSAKREQAARRQGLVREVLDGFAVRGDPSGYFAWWELPERWRADSFTAAAAARGIAVTPGTAFRVDPKRTPDAVRIGLASAAEPELAGALRTLAGLAAQHP